MKQIVPEGMLNAVLSALVTKWEAVNRCKIASHDENALRGDAELATSTVLQYQSEHPPVPTKEQWRACLSKTKCSIDDCMRFAAAEWFRMAYAALEQQRDEFERKGQELASAYGNSLIKVHDLERQNEALREALRRLFEATRYIPVTKEDWSEHSSAILEADEVLDGGIVGQAAAGHVAAVQPDQEQGPQCSVCGAWMVRLKDGHSGEQHKVGWECKSCGNEAPDA